jgi:hypothetical protein
MSVRVLALVGLSTVVLSTLAVADPVGVQIGGIPASGAYGGYQAEGRFSPPPAPDLPRPVTRPAAGFIQAPDLASGAGAALARLAAPSPPSGAGGVASAPSSDSVRATSGSNAGNSAAVQNPGTAVQRSLVKSFEPTDPLASPCSEPRSRPRCAASTR